MTQYIQDTWTVPSGPAGSPPTIIRALAQTADGYLWLGTSTGLMSFDGAAFQLVELERPATDEASRQRDDAQEVLAENVRAANRPVHSLLTDGDGTLWIGHETGLASLAPAHHRSAPLLHRIPEQRILSLARHGPDSLWIGGQSYGLSHYTPPADPLLLAEDDPTARGVLKPHLLNGVRVSAIARSAASRKLWLGSDRGLIEAGLEQNSLVAMRTFTEADGLSESRIQCLRRGADGSIWIGTRSGLNRLRNGRIERIQEFDEVDISALYLDTNNDLWVGTADRGVWLRRTGRWQHLPLRSRHDPAASPRVTSLLQDSDGSIWIGTAESQLYQLKNGQYRSFGPSEGMSSSGARHVIEDRSSGDIWVTTNDSRLNLIRDNKVIPLPAVLQRNLEQPGNEQGISALFQQPAGPLWIGTRSGVIWRYQGGDLRSIELPATSYGDRPWITTIARDSGGNLWLGTLKDGLYELNRDTLASRHLTIDDTPDLPHNTIRVLFLDRQNRLWISTLDGVTYYRDGSFAGPEDPLLARLPRFVHSFYQDREGILWFGTEAGLYWLRNGRIDYLDYSRGLYNDTIYAITADEIGNLWFGTQAGIFYILPSDRWELVSGQSDTVTSIPLSNQQDIECYGPRPNIGVAARNGSLYFATTTSLVKIDPAKVSPPAPPMIVIEKIVADGRELPHQDTIRLYADVGKLEIFFTSPYLREPERLRFHYRMQGLPNDSTLATERRATFTNLTPGDYRFEVWAEQIGGAGTPVSSWSLRIDPPHYQRPPVQALAILLSLVLSRGIYRLRLQKLLGRNQELEDTISERTTEVIEQREQLRLHNRQLAHANQELQHANEQLQDLNRQKADFLAIAAHDLRTPLVNLKGFASETGLLLHRLYELASPALDETSPDQRRRLEDVLRGDATEALEYIHSSTDRMDALIKGILMLSRLGRRQLHLETVDIQELVGQVLGNLNYEIVRKKVRVHVGGLPKVTADRPAMEQTLENLLRNAVSYLDPARTGELHVSSEETADEFRIHVRDNGRGIAPNQRDKVFKIFGRAGRNEDIPGEGIGLASVRTLIERHGGRIWFESEVGVGTTFTFSLPKNPRRVTQT